MAVRSPLVLSLSLPLSELILGPPLPTPLIRHLPPFFSASDAELIVSYRQSILDMINTPVSMAEEEASGEEYEQRAQLQEKLTIYLEAYTVLCAEWSYIVNGTRSSLCVSSFFSYFLLRTYSHLFLLTAPMA
jgi:hypothetical protein